MPVIYLDILFALNWWVDFLLLSATARLLGRPVRHLRLLLGAAVGAATAAVIFLTDLPSAASLGLQTASVALMVCVGFPFDGARHFLRTAVVLFLAAALFAGAVMAVWLLFSPRGLYIVDGVAYYDISPLALAAMTAGTYLVLCLIDRFRKRRKNTDASYWLRLRQGSETVLIRCFCDTGHHLKEPFSGRSAVVADVDAVIPVCPTAIPDWLYGGGKLPPTVRVIPFRTVGGEGLLPAFCPEEAVLLDGAGRSVSVSGLYVAVTDRLRGEEYQALIGTDLAELIT